MSHAGNDSISQTSIIKPQQNSGHQRLGDPPWLAILCVLSYTNMQEDNMFLRTTEALNLEISPYVSLPWTGSDLYTFTMIKLK